MQRLIYEVKPGSMHNLKMKTDTLAQPADSEVTIQVKCIGLNYADIFCLMGLYAAAPKTAFIPGLEFSGVVLQCGKAVSNFKPGDRIMGVTRFGAYTNFLNIDHKYIRVLPDKWSFEEGAAFPVQVLTAYYAIKRLGEIKKGDIVMIHSAAGGVGIQANRIAKIIGATTIGIIGSSDKISVLQNEKYDYSIVRSSGFKKEVEKILNGKDLNLVLEATGGKYLKWSYELLARMGRIVCYGSAEFTPSGAKPNYLRLGIRYLLRPKFDPLKMITENKSVMAFNLIWLYEKSELMEELMNEIDALHLPPPRIGQRFSFTQLHEALEIFKTGRTVGKLVVSTDQL